MDFELGCLHTKEIHMDSMWTPWSPCGVCGVHLDSMGQGKVYPKWGVNIIGKLISEGFGLSMSKSGKILKILSVWEKSFSLIFFLMF